MKYPFQALHGYGMWTSLVVKRWWHEHATSCLHGLFPGARAGVHGIDLSGESVAAKRRCTHSLTSFATHRERAPLWDADGPSLGLLLGSWGVWGCDSAGLHRYLRSVVPKGSLFVSCLSLRLCGHVRGETQTVALGAAFPHRTVTWLRVLALRAPQAYDVLCTKEERDKYLEMWLGRPHVADAAR